MIIDGLKLNEVVEDSLYQTTIYFSTANYISEELVITITSMEVSLTPNLPLKGGPIKRIELERIYKKDDQSVYDILDKSHVIKIPKNDVSSFYFTIIDNEKLDFKELVLDISYIKPSSSKKARMFKVVRGYE